MPYEQFRDEWLATICAGEPSTVELGRRFAFKIVLQWRELGDTNDNVVYCDGAGDGGIDIAVLERADIGDQDESAAQGDTWYLVQSKYGKAFHGSGTLLVEGQKVIDTLDGRRAKLSSLAEGLLERLQNFRGQASERDRIVLTFATEGPLTDDETRALNDLRNMGRGRLGPIFDVEAVSISTIHQRTLEQESVIERVVVPLEAEFVPSGSDLLVGSVSIVSMYNLLQEYRRQTEDLDRLYEKNVRRFLGNRRKVNKAMQDTLREAPEQFGLFNNGITIVVSDFTRDGNQVKLIDPYVVNGCQTTRTIWEVCHQRLESGGTGNNPELEDWRQRASQGVVVTKVVKVGEQGEALLTQITRYTNTQNTVRERDFIALTRDFSTWQKQLGERYGVYLEIQRGGWDSQRALQKQRPNMKQFGISANAFDLVKVYGSGWLCEPGLAFGKNAPFAPNGRIFKRIFETGGEGDEESVGADDLYAALLLQKVAEEFGFGRGAEKASRRQTKFLFYMVCVELVKDVLVRQQASATHKACTKAIIRLCAPGNEEAKAALFDAAGEFVDTYLTEGSGESLYDEPAYRNSFNNDLNGFLKWERLAKSEEDCPRLRGLLAMTKTILGRKSGGRPAPRDIIGKAILAGTV